MLYVFYLIQPEDAELRGWGGCGWRKCLHAWRVGKLQIGRKPRCFPFKRGWKAPQPGTPCCFEDVWLLLPRSATRWLRRLMLFSAVWITGCKKTQPLANEDVAGRLPAPKIMGSPLHLTNPPGPAAPLTIGVLRRVHKRIRKRCNYGVIPWKDLKFCRLLYPFFFCLPPAIVHAHRWFLLAAIQTFLNHSH